jgi:hypothetical protein
MRRSAARRNAEAAPPRLAPSSAKRKKETSALGGQSDVRTPTGEGMRVDAKVIDDLSPPLKSDLTAINQCWLHYRILDNSSFLGLCEDLESIEEMQHADLLDG